MKQYAFLILLIVFVGCAENGQDKSEDLDNTQIQESVDYGTDLVWKKNGITVYEALINESFSDASIELKTPIIPSTGPTNFEFMVENYELGAQTSDASERNCANSGKGQHIHFILNNQPYKAHYTNTFTEEMPEGTNVVLAFLSRSYHESIKTKSAHQVVKYGMGGQELDEPMLFYSRPKGTYAGADGKKLLLDFYLRNVSLSENGNKVRATIDGESFILPKWCPYFVEGLNVGEHTFQLELLDANDAPIKNLLQEGGDKIVGPYSNSQPRTITITAG